MEIAAFASFSREIGLPDDWEQLIVIEKVAYLDEGPDAAVCIAGKRAGPPEDCGGIWGYDHLLEVLADPNYAFPGVNRSPREPSTSSTQPNLRKRRTRSS
jgi:hypothetical protein